MSEDFWEGYSRVVTKNVKRDQVERGRIARPEDIKRPKPDSGSPAKK